MANKFLSETNLKFLLYDVHDAAALTSYDYYSQHTKKMFDMVLAAGIKLAKDKFHPSFKELDEFGSELAGGEINVHPVVREIMKECGEGGWIGASFPEKYDGEQLPIIITNAVRFAFAAANFSACAYVDLTAGAARLITSFGNDEMIDRYVSRMLSGKWQGTMALTEPDAGSSLSDITTEATPDDNGIYRMKGQKIFISAGDHVGVDNVVHLLLGRIVGAPPGVKGISLFLVPKMRFDKAGSLVPNDIVVTQIYHKLGYRGTPSTELSIGDKGDCHGYLVGKPNMGLSYMFQMMDESRLGVGMAAAATASAAYYAALEYAKDRPQGRRLVVKDPTTPQVPIIEHADIKRMLLFQRAVVEGSLSLLLQCAKYSDLAKVEQDEEKEKYELLLQLLTPIAKTYPSEMGILSTSQAIQCLGGYGYCDDFPVEQFYRDVRIHPIHEGTTGIQGMDLLGRKVIMHKGKAFDLFLVEVKETISAAREFEGLTSCADNLEEVIGELQHITNHKKQVAAEDGAEMFLADATLYLEYFSIVAVAWQWLKQAIVAKGQKADARRSKADFFAGKLCTFRYFFAYELPKTRGLAVRLLDSDAVTVEMTKAMFTD